MARLQKNKERRLARAAMKGNEEQSAMDGQSKTVTIDKTAGVGKSHEPKEAP